MIEVELPDGRILEFPDGTSPETMKAAAAKLVGGPQAAPPQAAPERSLLDRAGQFGAGVIDGTKAIIGGLPFGALGVNRLMMKNAEQTAENLGEPADATDRRLRTLGEYVGPSVPFGPAGMASSAASGLAAGQVREMGGGLMAEIAAALVAGGIPSMISNKVSKVAQTKRAVDAIPDIEDLQAAASAKYDAGRASGSTAPGALTQGLDARLSQIATDAGLVAPDGSLAPDYAKIGHALKMARSYAQQDMNPEQMQQVRRALQAAAQSADGNEARIGTMMLKDFDANIRNPLVPEFKEGDALWARAARGKEIKEAIDIAHKGRRSPGVNAISNEFQGLVRKGIRGDLTYPPELEAAVEKAANGSMGRQVAETIGKAAPTSVVGGGVGFGVPASVVSGVAGPVAGAAAGSAASGAGMMARLLANRMAQGDARVALATALNGAPLPEPQMSDAVKRAIAALLTSTAAAQAPR